MLGQITVSREWPLSEWGAPVLLDADGPARGQFYVETVTETLNEDGYFVVARGPVVDGDGRVGRRKAQAEFWDPAQPGAQGRPAPEVLRWSLLGGTRLQVLYVHEGD